MFSLSIGKNHLVGIGHLFKRYITTNTLLYEVLKVKIDDTPIDIKKQYYQLCKYNHPDLGGDEGKFLEINKAFIILKNANKKKMYDNLDSRQYLEFHCIWKTKFHPSRTKIKLVDNYLKRKNLYRNENNSLLKNAALSIVELGAFMIKNYHQNAIKIYEQTETQTIKDNIFSNRKKVFFILDISSSMKGCPNPSLPQNEKNKPYLSICLDNIKNICHDLHDENYIASLITFDNTVNIISNDDEIDTIKNNIDRFKELCENSNFDNLVAHTSIYDGLYYAIDNINKEQIDKTTFVLLTDGYDQDSQISLDFLIQFIKKYPINIIIMSINNGRDNCLKKIIDVSKSGKLIIIDDKINLKAGSFSNKSKPSKDTHTNVDSAFIETKAIIISTKYNGVSYIDIRREFDL